MSEPQYFYLGEWAAFDKPVPPPSTLFTDAPRVSLCFNKAWLPYVLGALKALVRPETWDADPATLGAMREDLYGGITAWKDECVSDVQFRQQTCLLQVSFDSGATWATIFDGSPCVRSILADSVIVKSLAPQTPNVCVDYPLVADAALMVELPRRVNAGDQISITAHDDNLWTDGILGYAIGTNHLYCIDGTLADDILGICGAGEPAHSGDPMPTANHMELIMWIDTVPYRILSGTVTVPAGVTNARVLFGVNDSALYDNGGTQHIDVQYCSFGWQHVFDFTLSDGGWVADAPTSGTPSSYSPGVGWVSGDSFYAGSGYFRAAFIHSPVVASRTWLEIKIQYSVHGLFTDGPSSNAWAYLVTPGGGATIHAFSDPIDADHHVDTLSVGWAGATGMDLHIASSLYTLSSGFTGSITIEKITISGLGTDPF